MAAKTMVGARALVYVEGVLVGLFDSVDYSVNISAEPIHILGRYSTAEIVPTAYEAVTVNCSGFRIIGNGAHVLPKMPKLQDIVNLEGITLQVVDRKQQAGSKPVLVVQDCIAVNYGTGYGSRSTSKIRVTYMGTVAYDESGEQSELNAASLP